MKPVSLALEPILPELFLAAVAMGLLVLGVVSGDRSTRRVATLSVLALIVAGFMLIVGPTAPAILGGMFVADAFARFMKLFVLLGSGLAIVMSLDYARREEMERFEFPVLMLLATVGMMLMVSANDLISLYLGIELQSLALYVIAAFRRDSVKSTEAGLKYFVLGALSSGMLLYGASLVYGFAGATGFAEIAAALKKTASAGAPPIGLIFGLVFVAAGLAFKVSAAPFHMWTPDVYEGAPTPVTAFFAIAPKIAATALLVRVMIGPFGPIAAQWVQIVWALSVLSMIVGAFAAIAQTNIKRLMAYSSIGHVGYALVGLAAADKDGVQAVAFYMAIYLFMNVATFAAILSMRRQGRMVENITDLAGLGTTHPMVAAGVAVAMFAMAGIPPLAGFFSKYYVFFAAIDAKLYILAVIGLLTSVFGAFYYLRIVKIMYVDEPAEALDRPIERPLGTVMLIGALFTLVFFVWPGPLYTAAGTAAASLFGS
jgi:NADH-quinone oxidoreductase subunit N